MLSVNVFPDNSGISIESNNNCTASEVINAINEKVSLLDIVNSRTNKGCFFINLVDSINTYKFTVVSF